MFLTFGGKRITFCSLSLIIFLSACNMIPGGNTPEEAVRKTFSSPDFQVTSVLKLDKGAVVLYHKAQPEIISGDLNNPSYQLGFSYVDYRDLRWWTRSGKSGSFTPAQGSKAIFLVSPVQTGIRIQKIDRQMIQLPHLSSSASCSIQPS